MAHVQLLLGLPVSGKTARCLSEYARRLTAARDSGPAGNTLWLAPAREARQTVLERLLPLVGGVAFQPNVLTFDRFADRVLMETNHDGRAIPGSARRLIVRHLIQDLASQRKLTYFERIAGTEGFLDVVIGFIAELKRAEIWPDAFLSACRGRFRSHPRDAELGMIYEQYQNVLLEKKWYDAEGRFWLARTAMQNSTTGFWRNLSLVVVDGFSDFTRTQQEMLEQLAMGSEMLVTLPLEAPVKRRELFAKPASVLAQLMEMFSRVSPAETMICSSEKLNRPAGLAQIHERLFENPRDVSRSSHSDGLEIIAAKGDQSEKVAVALRVKQLLANNVSPNDIIVGLRSAAVSGQAWFQYLSSAGIPVWCESPAPWSRSPYLKALFSVLQLETENWPFERVQGVLNSSYFRPQLPGVAWNHADSPRRITGWLRRLKLHSNRTAMLKGLARRRDRVAADDAEEDRSDLQLALQTLTELSDTLELVRKPRDLSGWADALATVTSRLGMAAGAESDLEDADRLQRLLRAAAPIEAELSETPTKRTLAEFLVLLRDVVQTDPPAQDARPFGRVRIVGSEMLRHLQPSHAFLVEMTEDAFPNQRSEDCLYSDAQRLELYQDGLALSHRELHQREEMLLFYQAVTRAGKYLTLSYSQVNSQGHEVYPSPYVTAICELFDPAIKPPSEGRLDPLPDIQQILTPTDLRLAAVSEARHKSPGWWRHLLAEPSTSATARNVLAAAHTAVQRFHTKGFTSYEGRLTAARNLADVAHRFGSDRQFSATELESFAQCPFRFWLSDVLELEPLAPPEIATDYAGRGNLVHDVLAKLAEKTPSEPSAVTERFRELVAERLQRQITDNDLQQALLRVEQDLLNRWAEAFGTQHADYLDKTTETKLTAVRTLNEVPFGVARDADAADPQQRFPALVLGTKEEAIRIGGRIDRIDIGEQAGRTVFTLIDYKTGRRPDFSTAKVETGQALQLALYTLAVLRLGIAGPDAVPLWMGYWAVKGTGFTPSGGKKWPALEQAVLSALETTLAEIVPQLVSRIRAGEFVVENDDDACTGHCAYHTVCRVNQIRPLADRLEKHRPPLIQSAPVGD